MFNKDKKRYNLNNKDVNPNYHGSLDNGEIEQPAGNLPSNKAGSEGAEASGGADAAQDLAAGGGGAEEGGGDSAAGEDSAAGVADAASGGGADAGAGGEDPGHSGAHGGDGLIIKICLKF